MRKKNFLHALCFQRIFELGLFTVLLSKKIFLLTTLATSLAPSKEGHSSSTRSWPPPPTISLPSILPRTMPSRAAVAHRDIVIIGGGIVGASTA